MTAFTPGLPAARADAALKSTLQTLESAKQNAILWFGEILDRQLYKELGYSTIHHYAEQELGFGSSKIYDYLNICRKLKQLPKVKDKVASGALGYTHARELLKVTDEKNQDQWLEVALNNPRKELERQVKQAKRAAADQMSGQPSLMPVPASHPAASVSTRVGFELSATQLARYEALWEKMRKMGGLPADRAEALLAMMDFFVAENSTRVENAAAAAPVQIHIHQCPDCERATVQTSRGEGALASEELAQAQCDAVISRPGRRNAATIPPKIRREVLTGARYQCQRPGCGNTRFLEIHHKVPRSRGGTNDADNLTCLCSGCHALHHATSAGAFVKSPPAGYRFLVEAAVRVKSRDLDARRFG